MKTRLPLVAIAVQCSMASPVVAQSLNMGSVNPNYGTVSLAPAFLPDPHSKAITSGGPLVVSTMNLGSGCVGYATSEPDYSVKVTGPMSVLTFYNEADGDTGLVINDAHGSWHCDDDGHTGVNPKVSLTNVQPGQYDIWVTSYSSSDRISGTLYISELQSNAVASASTSASLNMGSSNPNFGRASVGPGFSPDPYAVVLTSGGTLPVADMSLGSGCVGFATSEPDFILNVTGPMAFLSFYNEATGDTGLVINDASGAWHCDDDGHTGVNPKVSLTNVQPGQYDIWITSYRSSDRISGTLYFTEIRSDSR